MGSIRVHAFKKCEAVLDIVGNDPQLRSKAQNNVTEAISSAGYDVSPGELVILIDVITGSRQSPWNTMPNPGRQNPPRNATTDFMAELRHKWRQMTTP